MRKGMERGEGEGGRRREKEKRKWGRRYDKME